MLKGIALAIAGAAVIALFWIGGELHYQSCLQAAPPPQSSGITWGKESDREQALKRLGVVPSPPATKRNRHLNSCSRAPF